MLRKRNNIKLKDGFKKYAIKQVIFILFIVFIFFVFSYFNFGLLFTGIITWGVLFSSTLFIYIDLKMEYKLAKINDEIENLKYIVRHLK